MKNPYYNPEQLDLTIIGELDASEPYTFDMFVVWQHANGKLFYAYDSGCSCPTPFEGHWELGYVAELEDLGAFCEEVDHWVTEKQNRFTKEYYETLKSNAVQLQAKVSQLLRTQNGGAS